MEKYQSLKAEGTWKDRLHHVLSLVDRAEIEQQLRNAASHDDLQMLIILSKSTKHEQILFELPKTDSVPIRQQLFAAKGWLKIQQDEGRIFNYLAQMMTEKSVPRL